MGLFGRDERASQGPGPTSPTPAPPSHGSAARTGAGLTVVSRESRFEGTISGGGDIHVEGELRGEVDSSASLIIAEGGRVEASLHARVVIIAGTVKGNVSADERIELKPTADLTGNIAAPRILIQDGATFEGQVDMKAPTRGSRGKPPRGGAERATGETKPTSST